MRNGIRDLHGGAAMKGFRQSGELFRAPFEEPRPFLASQNPFLDILNGTNLDASPSSTSTAGDSHDDASSSSSSSSDMALTYISQILMEDDDKVDNFRRYDALQATEKPFYEILGQKYPPSPVQTPLLVSSQSSYSPPDKSISPNNGNSSSSSSSSSGSSSSSSSSGGVPERYMPFLYPTPTQSSFRSVNGSLRDIWEVQEDYLDGLSDLFRETEPPAWQQFRRGEEEARKFLPGNDKLVIDLEGNGYSFPPKVKEESRLAAAAAAVPVKPEKEEREYLYHSYESRGQKKNQQHSEDLDFAEGRRAKQSAVSYEDGDLRSGMLDDVLLCKGDHFAATIKDLRESLHILPNQSSQSGGGGGGGGGRGRGRKQPNKQVVDLRSILTQCAQMVAADDRRGAGELLKQIRQNSSDVGDGSQRLAHYFANGLEARLSGTGSESYNPIKQKGTATDHLKAYQLYLAVCPIKRISYFFSNQHIADAAESATRIHIVDFGISFGFQWPSLIQRLSLRANGAPKLLRITGIDFPQAGFRPRERLDETGLRLTEYAKDFGVPFEYKGISSRWEDVRIEDLGIDRDEVLIVNCLYMFRYLADETVAPADCPRDTVLNTVRKMKPDVFIHGVVNGSHNAPFFISRFREALFFFSATFDVFETNVPREDEQRRVIEREIFGQEIVNTIACEGLERVERPETYRQWQVRNLRAGFAQRPLNREVLKKAKDLVKGYYHKDFVVDQDRKWMLLGWKGRILFALTTWKP